MFHQTRSVMSYPTIRSSPPVATPAKPVLPSSRRGLATAPPSGYHVASDEPSRFSLRTVVVILISVIATGVSAYRIRDAFKTDTPQPSPFQELQKSHPEYAELIMSIRERDYDKVDRAITKDPWLVNFTHADSFGPALMLAAVSNQPDLVDLLIDRGADLNVRGRWGGTALHWAAWRGSADSVRALLARGADVRARSDNDQSTPLFWACRGSRESFWSRNNHAAAVRALLAAGAAPDATNSDGYASTAVASDEIAALLVQHGASPQPPATQPTFGNATGDPPRFGHGYGYTGYRRPESPSR